MPNIPDILGVNSRCWVKEYASRKIEITPLGTIRGSYSLDPDQNRSSGGPALADQTICKCYQQTKKSPLAWKELMVFITWE